MQKKGQLSYRRRWQRLSASIIMLHDPLCMRSYSLVGVLSDATRLARASADEPFATYCSAAVHIHECTAALLTNLDSIHVQQ